MPNESGKDKRFTETEVGALIENFDARLSLVAERLDGLVNWSSGVDSQLANIGLDVRVIKDVFRVEFPRLSRTIPEFDKRLKRVEAKVRI